MIKNEFNKNCQDLLINPAEATFSVRILSRDLRIYDILIVSLVLWYYFISRYFMFWFLFSANIAVFRKFGAHNIEVPLCFR